ncbi:MAG: bifunctional pyr operon transcriptional regulator/uracil phosphoribosyltransferase PyrR [Verrucomicrobium sp.]|nr:bifunctional pyr operon transcriptional regulator/uracil phosphoribosyltransferase PyrR [Verrucomicrobium sp.]
MSRPPEILLDGPALDRLLAELAARVAAETDPLPSLALVGLPTRGVTIATRLAHRIEAASGFRPPVGQIDVTFHRDDLDRRLPIPHRSEIPFDAAGRHILLVDDVLFTGRTVRAALSALGDFGRPASIRLLALVDRGHRQLPIQGDFIGKKIETALEDDVVVRLSEVDGADAVERHRP